MDTSRFKHFHFFGEDILSDLETICREFLYEYENSDRYSREVQLVKRILNFIESDNFDYYDA